MWQPSARQWPAALAGLLATAVALPYNPLRPTPTTASMELEHLMGRAFIDEICPTWPYYGPGDPEDFFLRIMPLGASIVWGTGSTGDLNGCARARKIFFHGNAQLTVITGSVSPSVTRSGRTGGRSIWSVASITEILWTT